MQSLTLFSLAYTATAHIYTLSLHDALPISLSPEGIRYLGLVRENAGYMGHLVDGLLTFSRLGRQAVSRQAVSRKRERSEEHTSELQSRQYIVCRLLLEKKKI